MLRLECVCVIVSERMSRPVLIAVDVTDDNSFGIMQALPRLAPFIGGPAGTYDLNLSIELPPWCRGSMGLISGSALIIQKLMIWFGKP